MASSPVRISIELYKEAERRSTQAFRSPTKQVELWTSLGERIERDLTPADIEAVTQGLAKIRIERVPAKPISFEGVFVDLEKEKQSGALSRKVLNDKIYYLESPEHPGLFERIEGSNRVLGKFVSGKFIARKTKATKKK